jgi:hypothetical protein
MFQHSVSGHHTAPIAGYPICLNLNPKRKTGIIVRNEIIIQTMGVV